MIGLTSVDQDLAVLQSVEKLEELLLQLVTAMPAIKKIIRAFFTAFGFTGDELMCNDIVSIAFLIFRKMFAGKILIHQCFWEMQLWNVFYQQGLMRKQYFSFIIAVVERNCGE